MKDKHGLVSTQYDLTDLFGGQGDSAAGMGMEGVFFIVVILVLLLQLRTRRVRPLGLVIMPVFILMLTLPIVAAELSTGIIGILLLGLGFIVGAGIGLAIGSMMEVKINEEDGSMMLKGSLMTVALWAGIIGLKIFGKDLLGGIGFIDMGLLTSVFLMMSAGMIMARRGFTYWRYLQMKKERNVQ